MGRPKIEDRRVWAKLPKADRIERWQRVAHVLRHMTKHTIEKHFNMSTWMSVTACGTVGCAAWHCALDPWFQRRGFGVKFEETIHLDGEVFKSWRWLTFDGGDLMTPSRFFGSRGYNKAFVNEDVMSKKTGERRTPRASHVAALRATNQYIKQLKA